jgi:serine/threonine-protein kinase
MDLQHFLTLYIKSALIGKRDADAVVAAFYAGRRELPNSIELDEFCSFLILSGRLTKWQADKLRAGKWKGFYLDNYLLLEQVGKGRDYSSYKARDTMDEKVVCLVIAPVALNDGRIKYRVEPYAA